MEENKKEVTLTELPRPWEGSAAETPVAQVSQLDFGAPSSHINVGVNAVTRHSSIQEIRHSRDQMGVFGMG